MLDFTIGLTEGVAWPWPIAVYLFLAGISGGAVAVAICVNLFRGVHLNTPIMKAATLIGFITIVLGMICLVLDLTNPLFFWRILVYYNPTSVMSIGVRHEHWRDGASVLYTARFRADVRCASAGNYVRELA